MEDNYGLCSPAPSQSDGMLQIKGENYQNRGHKSSMLDDVQDPFDQELFSLRKNMEIFACCVRTSI